MSRLLYDARSACVVAEAAAVLSKATVLLANINYRPGILFLTVYFEVYTMT